jgi:hypothetical protein
MPTFGANDSANAAPLWALTEIPNTAPNTANRTTYYGNTTGSYGIFGATQADTTGNPYGAGPGWVLVKRGSGGRAGRVQMEQLVAGGPALANNVDDASVFGIQGVYGVTDPVSKSVSNNTTNGFSVSYSTRGTANLALTVQWQYNPANNSGFVNATGGVYTGGTSNTLAITNVTSTLNNYTYRVILSGNGFTYTSSAATLTVT